MSPSISNAIIPPSNLAAVVVPPPPPSFKFDSALATFTPNMAIRAGALFAGAPMVQGKWDGSGVPDVLSFVRGTQIASSWFANMDVYQGSIAFIWTPERSRDASETDDENLIDILTSYNLRYEHDNARFVFTMGGQTLNVPYTSIAGTPVSIVASWDAKNKIDGTNYFRFSVNDTHSFGVTTVPASNNPDSPILIGSLNGTSNPANSRIEGLTIYRRVLFDGTNGIDVGNGDEIAQIYNSGTFKDPCEVTGSWDVVFCLPTNATPGTLATTGQAWSHPHSSNLITPADGFMTSTAWANWTDIGTPQNEAVLATAEKIFNWGYKFDTLIAGDGEEYTKVVAAGNDWVIRAIVHSADPVDVILYDKSNGAEIGKLTSAGATTRTAPFVAIFTGEAPAGCISLGVRIQGTAVTQTVYCHQVELLTNQISNPSLQGGAGDPWIPTGWGNTALDAGDTAEEVVIVHSGLASVRFADTASSSESMSFAKILTAGLFVCLGAWTYGSGTHGMQVFENDPSRAVKQATLATPPVLTTPASASWSHNKLVARMVGGTLVHRLLGLTGAVGNRYTDDSYVVSLTAVALTVTPASLANSTETSGIRVDGLDTLTQPVPATLISNERIEVRFKYTPRHGIADIAKFGVAEPVIFTCYKDASNQIVLASNLASRLTVTITASGTSIITASQTGVTGIDAGTTYDVVFVYTKGVGVVITFNGVEKYNKPVLASADFLALTGFTMYWGTRNNLDRQRDVTFAALA